MAAKQSYLKMTSTNLITLV